MQISKTHEYLLIYSKSDDMEIDELEKSEGGLPYDDSKGAFDLWKLRNRNPKFEEFNRPNLWFPFYISPTLKDKMVECPVPFVPVEMRETGMRGAINGAEKEVYARADREPASSG
jgi:adenine-specific DNA-methyltransferase